MLCKSASSLVPLTSRLVGRVNRHYHHSAVFIASNHPNRKQISSSFNVPDFHLSTAAATTKTMKPSADESVEESTPSEFPFKIEDNPGQYTAILTREYLIKVEAHMPTSSTIGGDHYRHPIKMVINISKNDRPSLEFTCIGQLSKNEGPSSEFTCDGTLFPVSILEFSVKNSENSSEDSTIKNATKSENSEDY
ncbi:hypothetical protein Q3G72_005095 [Acer saccharum]|nr:hypothetical protein Q3G72_005095 [Acer saccharum]